MYLYLTDDVSVISSRNLCSGSKGEESSGSGSPAYESGDAHVGSTESSTVRAQRQRSDTDSLDRRLGCRGFSDVAEGSHNVFDGADGAVEDG